MISSKRCFSDHYAAFCRTCYKHFLNYPTYTHSRLNPLTCFFFPLKPIQSLNSSLLPNTHKAKIEIKNKIFDGSNQSATSHKYIHKNTNILHIKPPTAMHTHTHTHTYIYIQRENLVKLRIEAPMGLGLCVYIRIRVVI